MKNTGIIRRVDELGRVVIPKEIRENFEIMEKDPLEIFVEKDTIILKKFFPVCTLCGSQEGLKEYKEKVICEKCIEQLRKMLNE